MFERNGYAARCDVPVWTLPQIHVSIALLQRSDEYILCVVSALIQCHAWVLFSSFVLSNRARMCVLDHFARKMNEPNLLRFRSLFRCFYSFLLGVSSYFTINFDEQRRCNCPINISCKMNWTNEHTTHNTLTHTNTQYSISFNFIINHEVHWIRHFLYCWISFCLFFFSYTLYFLQCGATRQPHHNRRHHRWMTQLHNNHRIKKNRVFNFNGPGSQ